MPPQDLQDRTPPGDASTGRWSAALAIERERTTSPQHDHHARNLVVLICLGLAAVLAFLASLALGPVPVPPAHTFAILIDAVSGRPPQTPGALVVTEMRLPRALLALLAGAGLGAAGMAMQTYFRNPLADPGVTGVASGAAVGAVTVLVLGVSIWGPWTLPLAACIGALVVLLLIQAVALFSRDRSVTTVLLIGIAVNAFCGAVTGAIIANADDPQKVRGAVFWLQGDLTVANAKDLALVAPPVLVGVAILFLVIRELNALLLGDETAQSMGVPVTRVRGGVLVIASVIVGSIVSVTGVIGFVGLVAPHMVRILLGSNHRWLLPGSILLGAAFLTAADLTARLAPAGTSWQTGIITALVGSPVFVALVLRARHPSRSSA